MATSINGYPVLKPGSPYLKVGRVPGSKKAVRLRKEVLPIFLAILSEIDKTVIDLDRGPLDGHSYRAARYTRKWSNHSSGTAIDFRYDKFPADRRVHMTASQRKQMHALLNKYRVGLKRIFIWGGDWTVGRTMDEMHLEIARGVTISDINKAMARLGIRSDGTFTGTKPAVTPVTNPVKKPAPKPAVKPTAKPGIPTIKISDAQPNKRNSSVKVVQNALVKAGLLKSVYADGHWTRTTAVAYAAWQRKLGFKGAAADGKPGITSLSKLAQKYNFRLVK